MPVRDYLDEGGAKIPKENLQENSILLLGSLLPWNPDTQKSATLQEGKTTSHLVFVFLYVLPNICVSRWRWGLVYCPIYTDQRREHWKLIQINYQYMALLCFSLCLSYLSCFSDWIKWARVIGLFDRWSVWQLSILQCIRETRRYL